jgi:hypothetical protein
MVLIAFAVRVRQPACQRHQRIGNGQLAAGSNGCLSHIAPLKAEFIYYNVERVSAGMTLTHS